MNDNISVQRLEVERTRFTLPLVSIDHNYP
jgi:hypothetical protein